MALHWLLCITSGVASVAIELRQPLESDVILSASAYESFSDVSSKKLGRSLGGAKSLDFDIMIKFRDDAHLRSNGTALVTSVNHLNDSCAEQVTLAAVESGLRFHPTLSSLGSVLEAVQQRAGALSHRQQPDLRGYALVELRHNDPAALVAAAEKLHSLPCVEYVSIESNVPPPPPSTCHSLGDDFHVGQTPDFTARQEYRGPDPGMDTDYANAFGGDGESVRYADVEYDMNILHEDLIGANIKFTQGESPFDTHHGTASVSITKATGNGFGITGVAPKADAFFFPDIELGTRFSFANRARAIAAAIANSREGDVVLLENQLPGACKNGGFHCPSRDKQYVLSEFEQQIWDIVKMGTDAGVIVVATAGNGAADLDGPGYAAYRARGDSGAIVVGAGTALDHTRASFSTYGSRVDVQGWGDWSVMTAGYGDCDFVGASRNRTYTPSFAGTSSAGALVAGAVTALQSFSKKTFGRPLRPKEMRDLLKRTGVPQSNRVHGNVGPHVNLRNAILALYSTATTTTSIVQHAETTSTRSADFSSGWRIMTGSSSSGWAWDVRRVKFLTLHGEEYSMSKCTVTTSGDCCRGYEGTNAFNDGSSFWGGRKNTHAFFIGLLCDVPEMHVSKVQILQDNGDHFANGDVFVQKRTTHGNWQTIATTRLAINEMQTIFEESPASMTTTSSMTTSTAAASAECSGVWKQCGGTGWSGYTCCVSGSECKGNIWYSQCTPSEQGHKTPVATTTSTRTRITTATTVTTTTSATTAPSIVTTTTTAAATTMGISTTQASFGTERLTTVTTATARTITTLDMTTSIATTASTAAWSTPATTTTAESLECAELWRQCGGQGWTGATCCVAGSACQGNKWYKQCHPRTRRLLATKYGDLGHSSTILV